MNCLLCSNETNDNLPCDSCEIMLYNDVSISKFDKLAKNILLNYYLDVNGNKCQIMEIEFYQYSDNHKDIFVHRHPEQKTFWKWYFHRTRPTLIAKYKSGTYKGMDLTLGNEKCYFGMLIRGINTPNDGPISGPCNSVNYILRSHNVNSIDDLIKNFNLRLVRQKTKKDTIMSGPRIGLKHRDNEHKKELSKRRYRYITQSCYKFVKKAKRSLKKI